MTITSVSTKTAVKRGFSANQAWYNIIMRKQYILQLIVEDLKSLSSESAKDLYYKIDGYADSYSDDSMGTLIYNWERFGFGNFRCLFPITAKLYSDLKKANDGIEHPKTFYANLIALANKSVEEIINYIKTLS